MTDNNGVTEGRENEHVYKQPCPHCGYDLAETVGVQKRFEGMVAIRECVDCGQLWGERRDFFGVVNGD